MLSIISLIIPIGILSLIALITSIKGIKECLPSTKNKWQGVVGIIISLISLVVSAVFILNVALPMVQKVKVNITPPPAQEQSTEQVDTVRSTASADKTDTSATETPDASQQKILTGEDEFGDLDAVEDTKEANDTLPEIGEYEAYRYWGAFRRGTVNGY